MITVDLDLYNRLTNLGLHPRVCDECCAFWDTVKSEDNEDFVLAKVLYDEPKLLHSLQVTKNVAAITIPNLVKVARLAVRKKELDVSKVLDCYARTMFRHSKQEPLQART